MGLWLWFNWSFHFHPWISCLPIWTELFVFKIIIPFNMNTWAVTAVTVKCFFSGSVWHGRMKIWLWKKQLRDWRLTVSLNQWFSKHNSAFGLKLMLLQLLWTQHVSTIVLSSYCTVSLHSMFPIPQNWKLCMVCSSECWRWSQRWQKALFWTSSWQIFACRVRSCLPVTYFPIWWVVLCDLYVFFSVFGQN